MIKSSHSESADKRLIPTGGENQVRLPVGGAVRSGPCRVNVGFKYAAMGRDRKDIGGEKHEFQSVCRQGSAQVTVFRLLDTCMAFIRG